MGSDEGPPFSYTLRNHPRDPAYGARSCTTKWHVTLTGSADADGFHRPYTEAQRRTLTYILAHLGDPANGVHPPSPALHRSPYFPRRLWSPASLVTTLYALLGPGTPDCPGAGLVDGVHIVTEEGAPYQDPRLNQPSDEAQALPWRFTLDVDTETFTAEPVHPDEAYA